MIKNCDVCGREFDALRTMKRCSPECVKEWQRRYARAHYAANPEPYKARAHAKTATLSPSERRHKVLRRYKLTEEQFEEMKAAGCAICGTHHAVRWVVDHDHSCCPGTTTCGRCIRGVLCHQCNIILGMARDDQGILAAAIRYLEAS